MEKTTKHTPGPWKSAMWSKYREVSDAENRRIAVVHGSESEATRDIAEANARLIAAAPELLEALRRTALSLGQCLADPLNPCWDNRPSDVIGKHWGNGDACSYCWARAAIAKAEGDS